MTGEALEAYVVSDRKLWVTQWPGQCVLAVSSKYWTQYIHEAIRKGGTALYDYLQVNNSQIEDIVAMVRGKLSKQNRVTLQALIVLDVHGRDVLAQLVDMDMKSEYDFSWLSQLRYYWEVSFGLLVVKNLFGNFMGINITFIFLKSSAVSHPVP